MASSGLRAGDLIYRVTPIDAQRIGNARALGVKVPLAGVVYSVRSLRVYEGVECVLLNEIINPKIRTTVDGPVEPGWLLEHFRPVRDTSKQLAFLKEIAGVQEKVK